MKSCHHCGDPINPDGTDYYMMGRCISKTIVDQLWFHSDCFESIAGKRYTEKMQASVNDAMPNSASFIPPAMPNSASFIPPVTQTSSHLDKEIPPASAPYEAGKGHTCSLCYKTIPQDSAYEISPIGRGDICAPCFKKLIGSGPK